MKKSAGRLNPAHLTALMDMVNASPFFRLLGLELKELEPGFCRAELMIADKHMNPFGSIHGGVCASLIDTAAYWAAYCNQDEDTGFTSLDLTVTNLSMARTGRLTAFASAIKEGKSVGLCDVKVQDDAGNLIAHGTSKLLMLKGKQAIPDALREMGYDALPPKFL